ncbi:hypothetical protein D8780_03170 [Notoacmeibacter ruber]|uniref:Uncharacterized protein n=2 Tax=Notoacmeibacter ruber TaxID=2670375 RepID=A0A3L7J9D9_9HYPH|nr:hypothetical protein D8780_03170 [Notoacmeibacter ruber]
MAWEKLKLGGKRIIFRPMIEILQPVCQILSLCLGAVMTVTTSPLELLRRLLHLSSWSRYRYSVDPSNGVSISILAGPTQEIGGSFRAGNEASDGDFDPGIEHHAGCSKCDFAVLAAEMAAPRRKRTLFRKAQHQTRRFEPFNSSVRVITPTKPFSPIPIATQLSQLDSIWILQGDRLKV